jgi:methylornithine synthase
VLLDLTMGEDPLIHSEPGYAGLLELVEAVSTGIGLPVMVSPGVLPAEALAALKQVGSDWYALYQETHSTELYARLRVGQPFAARVAARSAARRAGLLVEDGLLTGIGDTPADRARSIVAMRDAGWEQVRVMTFVPQAGTPLAGLAPTSDEDELLTIAAMRLAMPDRLIPASLDVDGIAGLDRRLNAGADVVTSIVPPTVGLAGVSQSELDIDEGHRTVAGVLPHLERLGLRAGTVDEYRERMAALRGTV